MLREGIETEEHWLNIHMLVKLINHVPPAEAAAAYFPRHWRVAVSSSDSARAWT